MYNFADIPKRDESNLLSAKPFLPVGTHLVIKNPSYEIVEGNTMIRSDNPKDVIVISDANKLFSDLKWSTKINLNFGEVFGRSADGFRLHGNDYLLQMIIKWPLVFIRMELNWIHKMSNYSLTEQLHVCD